MRAAVAALADTVHDDYDVVTHLQTLVDLAAELTSSDVGAILMERDGSHIAAVASTSEGTQLVELLQVQSGFGPCVEAFSSGRVVEVPDIAATGDRWPVFQEAAQSQGYGSALSLPLMLRSETTGSLNLFRVSNGSFDPAAVDRAKTLATLATIGILNARVLGDANGAREQLQTALDSRIVIEQAKGIVAQAHGFGVDEAFRVLREYSRSHSRPLREVADQVVRRVVTL